MIKKDELYFGGTTSGETLKPFLFHVVMMFVLPVMAFFFSRDMLASRGYSDKDRNIYAGFISIVFVILVIVSYVLRIIADEDNWTPQKSTATVPAHVPAAVENKNSKQAKAKAKTQTQTTPAVVQNIQEIKTTQNTKKPAQDKNVKKVEKVEEPKEKEVKTSKSNNETNTITQRDTNTKTNQKKEKNATPAPATATGKKNSKKETSKNAPKSKAKKEEEVKQPPVQQKRKIKSNNPFDYII